MVGVRVVAAAALMLVLAAASVRTEEALNPWARDEILSLSDKCFCKLEGHIDDCSCKVNTVDDFNNKKIYPRLKSLVSKDFFRYFQYQPNKKCKFWDSSSGKCSSSYCQVKQCATTDLPPGWHQEEAQEAQTINKYSEEANKENDCDKDYEVFQDQVDSTLSESISNDLKSWRQHDEEETNFCDMEEIEGCQDCVHVDLTLNPERYTGYSGEASRRIWRTIYEENCFNAPTSSLTTAKTRPSFGAAFGHETVASLCLEKRAFFRAVSGLHASITIHLTANYPTKKMPSTPFLSGSSSEVWGPNVEMFQARFDPDSTHGQGPYWLKNLYFVYLLELRAIAKAAPYLAHQTFFTGRDAEDKETLIAVRELLNLISNFPDHFDETSMFTGGRQAEV